jgi:hypothetical protein
MFLRVSLRKVPEKQGLIVSSSFFLDIWHKDITLMVARAEILPLPLVKAGNFNCIKLPNPRMVLTGAIKNRIFGIVTLDQRVAGQDHIRYYCKMSGENYL